MDFDRIHLLLEVFHKSLDVPGLENIRRSITEELRSHNNPAAEATAVGEILSAEPEQGELTYGARRI